MTTPITLEQVDNAINEILNEALCYRDRYGDARENARMISDYITQQRDEVERMAERLRVANEALQFYADEENHKRQLITEDCGCCSYWHDAKVTEDAGSIAQAALKAQVGAESIGDPRPCTKARAHHAALEAAISELQARRDAEKEGV